MAAGRRSGTRSSTKRRGMKFVFHKRAASRRRRRYYLLSGKGVMTVDDKPVDMTPGTGVLTRPGSSHSLKQVGSEDLVVLGMQRG